MTINSKKFFGMLFVGLAMLIANPSLGWTANTLVDAFIQNHDAETEEILNSTETKISDDLAFYQLRSSGRAIIAIKRAMSQLKSVAENPDKDNYNDGWWANDSGQKDRFQVLNDDMDTLMKEGYITEDTRNLLMQKAKEYDKTGYDKLREKLRSEGKLEELAEVEESHESAIEDAYIVKTDADGKRYKVNAKGEQLMMQGAFDGCEKLPSKLYKQRKCFFCPLFAVIYRAADNMAVIGFSKLSGGFATLLALGLGLYIAFQTLTHVSSLTKQDAPKFLGTLLRQIFKFLIAFILLQYSLQVYQYIVNPILNAGLSFGNALLTQGGICERGEGETVSTIFYMPALYKKLECFITNVQKEIAFMQTIGTSLMCIGGNAMMFQGGTIDFGDGFWMALQGLLIGGFGFLLSLAFAFYLIDAVVQLGIVGALMPFLIASWPFKLTAQYTSKGFSMLLNSFFVFVFIGLVVSVNLQLVDAAMENGAQSAQTQNKTETNTKGAVIANGETVNVGGLKALYDAINGESASELKKLTDISGTAFIILLICCIFGFKFCAQASALADKMASGGLKGIGSSIGTMAASAAVSGAKKITKPVRDAVGDRADALVKAAPGAILGAPKALYNKFKKKGAGGGDDEKKKSDETPAKSTGPVTLSQNKGNKEGNESTPKTESEKPKENDANKNKEAELKNEFAQTDLGKGLEKGIVQSKAKEDVARQREIDAKGRVKSNSEKLAGMSDKNSPEAQGLSASIASDRKQEESAKKEADEEHKKGQSLQKKKAAAEKGYVSKRKSGGSVADANKEAATKASKQDNYTENTRNENEPRQRGKSESKKSKKRYSRRK